MIDKKLPVEAKINQAEQLAESLMNGAAVSLHDQSFASMLREPFVRPSIEKIKAGLTGVGEKLQQAICAKLTAEVDTTPRFAFERGACFVKGTLVHTKEGLASLEKLKIGDWVLSKSENGDGERAYKRVVNTFVHRDK